MVWLGLWFGRDGGGFAGAGDDGALLFLMVEVDLEDGVSAMIPDGLGDGEVEEDHALGGLAGVDDGLAEEGFGRAGFEGGEGGVDVVEILLLDGAGGELFAFGGGEGGGEVFEEEGELEGVFDVEAGEDVEVVLGLVFADEDGVGLEDGVGGDDGGAGDGELGDSVRGGSDDQGEDDAESQKRKKNGSEEIAARGLGEGRRRHLIKNNLEDRFKDQKPLYTKAIKR
jgi:hypothetical protein